jgi:hypothetical protein
MKYLSNRLSAAMWSRVLLLWVLLGIVALLVGGAAIGMGRFVQDNIRTELAAQQITFNAADKLSEEEAALPGMVENAGLPLTTGNQAKVYAGLIGLHVSGSAEEAGYPGASYASLGAVQRELRAAVATATEEGDEAAIAEAQAELDAVTGLRNTMLSAYGWDNVATGIIAAGGVFLALALVFIGLFVYELRLGHLPITETQDAVKSQTFTKPVTA